MLQLIQSVYWAYEWSLFPTEALLFQFSAAARLEPSQAWMHKHMLHTQPAEFAFSNRLQLLSYPVTVSQWYNNLHLLIMHTRISSYCTLFTITRQTKVYFAHNSHRCTQLANQAIMLGCCRHSRPFLSYLCQQQYPICPQPVNMLATTPLFRCVHDKAKPV